MNDNQELIWIKKTLDEYGNCVIGRTLAVKKRDELLQNLASKGIPCRLTVVMDDGSVPESIPNSKKATYILTKL